MNEASRENDEPGEGENVLLEEVKHIAHDSSAFTDVPNGSYIRDVP